MKSFGNAPDALSGLKPTILLSHLSGITYFRGSWKRYCFYRVLVLLVLALCLMHEIPTVAFWIGESKSLHAVLAAFETSLRWTLLFFNNIVTAFRNPKINKVVKDLIDLNLDLGKPAFKKAYRFQILQIFFNLFFMSCFMMLGHNFIWYNINKRWYTAVIYIFTEFYIAFAYLQFSALAYIFGETFKTFNENLSSMRKRMKSEGRFLFPDGVGNHFKRRLNDFRKRHLKLSQSISELNDCYTVQLLFFVLLSFVEIVYSLRAFFLHVVNKRTSEAWKLTPVLAFIHMVFWGSYYFLAVVQIVALCDRIVNESKYTSLIVHKTINEVEHPDLERELEIFSMQILRNEVRFVACGFFKLDFALIHSIIAAVTTYLVVLISIREDTD